MHGSTTKRLSKTERRWNWTRTLLWRTSFLGFAYVQKSMYKEGIAEFEKAVVISPGNLSLSWLGYGYAAAGKRAEAQKVLDQLNELSKERYVAALTGP